LKVNKRQKSANASCSKIDPDTNQRLIKIESDLDDYYKRHQRLNTATQRKQAKKMLPSPSAKSVSFANLVSKKPFDLIEDLLNPNTVNVKQVDMK